LGDTANKGRKPIGANLRGAGAAAPAGVRGVPENPFFPLLFDAAGGEKKKGAISVTDKNARKVHLPGMYSRRCTLALFLLQGQLHSSFIASQISSFKLDGVVQDAAARAYTRLEGDCVAARF
jgi:hypothetical protein